LQIGLQLGFEGIVEPGWFFVVSSEKQSAKNAKDAKDFQLIFFAPFASFADKNVA
jgi:hypothetical protein